MKRFSRNNLTLVFFQKEDDKKFSFYIENETELTEHLLATVKTKRVNEDKIKYAVNGIFDLIENNLLITKKVNEMEKNPIIELAELVQKQFGANRLQVYLIKKERIRNQLRSFLPQWFCKNQKERGLFKFLVIYY